MEFIAELILSEGRMNGAITGVAFGILGALLGVLVGKILSKTLNKGGIVQWTVIIFVALSLQTPRLIKPYLADKYGTAQKEKHIQSIITDLESHRILSVIFRYHPDARGRLTDKMMDIIYNGNSTDAIFQLSQQATSEIVGEYVYRHLPAAPSNQIAILLKRNYEVLMLFKDRPKLCVDYYLGQPKFSPSDITADFIEQEGNLKADIIESAVQNPSIPPRAADIEEIVTIIVQGYEDKGYNLDNLSKIDAVQTLKPEEGCSVATEFSDVLASLDAETGAFVFKNFLYLDAEDSNN